jgi:hypothetical protein
MDEIEDRTIEGLWRAFEQLGVAGVALGRITGYRVRPRRRLGRGRRLRDATISADRA